MKKVLPVIMLLASINLSSQALKPVKKQSKIVKPVYLLKSDTLYTIIKSRVINDLKNAVKSANPKSEENILKAKQLKSLPKAKQDQYYALFEKSISDYTEQLHFDFETFMLVFSDLGDKGLKKMETECDFRVKNLGDNKYAAEFWEDAIAANSEANAIIWANELIEIHPNDKTILATVKETYAKARKSVMDGKQVRYSEIMALMYTKEKNGLVVFHNPGQALIDFK